MHRSDVFSQDSKFFEFGALLIGKDSASRHDKAVLKANSTTFTLRNTSPYDIRVSCEWKCGPAGDFSEVELLGDESDEELSHGTGTASGSKKSKSPPISARSARSRGKRCVFRSVSFDVLRRPHDAEGLSSVLCTRA